MKKTLQYVILIMLALTVVFSSCSALAEEIADVTHGTEAKVEAPVTEEAPKAEESEAPKAEATPAPAKEEASVKVQNIQAPKAEAPEATSAPAKEEAPVKEEAPKAEAPEATPAPAKEEAPEKEEAPKAEESEAPKAEEPAKEETPVTEEAPKAEEPEAPVEEVQEEAENSEAKPEKAIVREIRISVLQDKVQYGETFTLCAELIGYEGAKVDLQWQYNDGKGWQNADRGNGLNLDVKLTEETAGLEWRLEAAVA